MRSELLKRIQDLLQNEDLEAIRKDVRNAIQSFRALTQDEIRSQKEAWEQDEHDLDETFVYKPFFFKDVEEFISFSWGCS